MRCSDPKVRSHFGHDNGRADRPLDSDRWAHAAYQRANRTVSPPSRKRSLAAAPVLAQRATWLNARTKCTSYRPPLRSCQCCPDPWTCDAWRGELTPCAVRSTFAEAAVGTTRDVSAIRALGRADRLPARQRSRDRYGVSRAQSAGGGDDLAPVLRLAGCFSARFPAEREIIFL
jgi:hypothetical protein